MEKNSFRSVFATHNRDCVASVVYFAQIVAHVNASVYSIKSDSFSLHVRFSAKNECVIRLIV